MAIVKKTFEEFLYRKTPIADRRVAFLAFVSLLAARRAGLHHGRMVEGREKSEVFVAHS